MSLLRNTGLVLFSIAVALLGVEFLSRYAAPVSPGVRNLDLSGNPVAVNTPVGLRLRRNLVYRQISNEFDVKVSIGEYGNRVPDPQGSPEVIFLGDSFTFGQGLKDHQTFPYIYCQTAKLSCANLGRSGTGTGRQLDIFQHYLDTEGWRPKRVKLFVMAMSGSFLAGNDLHDNYFYDLVQKRSGTSEETVVNKRNLEPTAPTWFEKLIAQRGRVLEWSNLARFLYFKFGPEIKASLSPEPASDLVRQALAATRIQLSRLGKLADRYGFDYQIYLLYPVQDLILGSHTETASVLKSLIERDVEFVDTAAIFSESPEKFYFSYDGHFNSAGSRRLADFLLKDRE